MNIWCWIGPVTKFYGGYMQYIVKKEGFKKNIYIVKKQKKKKKEEAYMT